MKFETISIHRGEEPDFREGASGDVVIPIHLSSTFARVEVDKPTGGYEYSRTLNPTRKALEQRLATIENGKFAFAFSSGAAASTVLLLSFIKSGSHIIAGDDLYGGSRRIFEKIFRKNYNIQIDYIDTTDCINIEAAIRENTRLIWIETPSNPLLKISDIKAISKIARENKILFVVDNTFATPYLQNPLDLGSDIVLHSTTKYINGHSDSIGGAIVVKDEDLATVIRFNQNAAGAILSPFDSYMVLRGIKTLSIRMERHCENAQKITEFLSKHTKVRKVYYPGLVDHPQHTIAKTQMRGYGGMISFEIEGGIYEARRFLSNLKIISLAESLGGVESLIEHPATMTHMSVPHEHRIKVGITDSLIRFSVGIENIDDLISDLDNALRSI